MRKLSLIYISIILILFFCGYYFFRLDDSFIFYKYAKNIAEGNGYVFNLGEKVNATTSPLYTLILAFLYLILNPFFSIDFVILGNLISIFSISLLLYSINKLFNDDEKFTWFALIFLAMPLLKFGFGMETFLNLSLIIFSIYLYTKDKITLASAFIALSVLARFDSALFAGIIFVHYTITKKKLPPFLSILVFLLVILPWFIFSKIYFDSFLPTTIGAKLSQHNLGLFGPGFIFLTNSIRVIPGGYLTVITILLLIISSSIYLLKNKIIFFTNTGLSILIIWSSALFITYAFIINAPPYQWYYTPFAIPAAIVTAFAIPHLINKISLQKLTITILFLTACVLPIKNIIQGYNPKYTNYINAVTWLNKNAPNGSLLAVDDIGILGYHYKRGKLVDALGLVSPIVTEHLKHKDYDWFLKHFNPEYVVNEYPFLQKHLRGNEKTFWQNYKVVKIYESEGEKIAIYSRVYFKKL